MFKDVQADKESCRLLEEWSKGELQLLKKELEVQGTSSLTRIGHLEAIFTENEAYVSHLTYKHAKFSYDLTLAPVRASHLERVHGS